MGPDAVVGTWSEACAAEGMPAPGSGVEAVPKEVSVGLEVGVRSAGAVEGSCLCQLGILVKFGGLGQIVRMAWIQDLGVLR